MPDPLLMLILRHSGFQIGAVASGIHPNASLPEFRDLIHHIFEEVSVVRDHDDGFSV